MPLLVSLEEPVTAKFDGDGAAGDVMPAADVVDRLSSVDGILQVSA